MRTTHTTRVRHNYRRRYRKSYFVLPNEVLEAYSRRAISAVDATVLAYLHSAKTISTDYTSEQRRLMTGVCVSRARIANMCGISVKTVSASVDRLCGAGFIGTVIMRRKKRSPRFEASIYCLKPLPMSGFFFVPRSVFRHALSSKMFVVYLDFCRQHSFEYGKSWNSYNDICVRLGFGAGARSEIIRLVKGLVQRRLITKKTRRVIKGNGRVFVDNIYIIVNYVREVSHKIVRNFDAGVRVSLVYEARISITKYHSPPPIPITDNCVQLSLYDTNGYAKVFAGVPF